MNPLTEAQVRQNLANFNQQTLQQPIGGAVLADGTVTQNGTTPISTTALQGATKYTLPQVKSTEANTNLGMRVAPATPMPETPSTPKTAQQTALEQISSLTKTQGEQSAFTAQAQADAGLEQARLADQAINKEAADTKLKYDAEIEKLKQNRGGMIGEAFDARVSQLESKRNQELANIAIRKSVAQGDITTALAIVKDKVDAKFEPIKNQIDTLKAQYSLLQNDMSESDKVKAQAEITKQQQAFELKKIFENKKGDMQARALETENLALFNALDRATNNKEVASAIVNNTVATGGNTKAEQIAQDMFNGVSSLRLADLPTAQRASVDAELTKLKNSALQSGDMIGLIKSSAGGKEVSDTFTQSFEKALSVVGQTADLQEQMKGVKTGPILGAIRSRNPYDEKAQVIKAQLKSIVPNLARGIYGEVGVLTDADIDNYTQTIANLKSTEEVNSAIMSMTVRAVQRSLDNKIKTQAGFGRDVSGILPTYIEVKKLADSLLAPNTTQTYNGIIIPKQNTGASTYNGVTLPN